MRSLLVALCSVRPGVSVFLFYAAEFRYAPVLSQLSMLRSCPASCGCLKDSTRGLAGFCQIRLYVLWKFFLAGGLGGLMLLLVRYPLDCCVAEPVAGPIDSPARRPGCLARLRNGWAGGLSGPPRRGQAWEILTPAMVYWPMV